MASPAARGRLALALLGALGQLACSSADAPASLPSIGAQPELARAAWLSYTRRSLRRESCDPLARFRRCSDLDRDECEQRMTVAMTSCIAPVSKGLPARIAAGAPDRLGRDQLTGCIWHMIAMELGPARVDMLCLLSSK